MNLQTASFRTSSVRTSSNAVATFDHELLPKGIHEWLRRRFNAFMVAFNSALAILIALTVVGIRRCFYTWSFDPSCGLSEMQWQQQASLAMGNKKWWWLVTSVSLLVLLFLAARASWRETMEMVEFQAQRKNVYELKERKANKEHTNLQRARAKTRDYDL